MLVIFLLNLLLVGLIISYYFYNISLFLCTYSNILGSIGVLGILSLLYNSIGNSSESVGLFLLAVLI
jgi:hypothetical protein